MGKRGPKPRLGPGARRESYWSTQDTRTAVARLLTIRQATNPKAKASDVVRDALLAKDAESFVAYQANVQAELTQLRHALQAALDRETALERLVSAETEQRDRSEKRVLEAATRILRGDPARLAEVVELADLEASGSIHRVTRVAAVDRAREILGSWKAVLEHVQAP